jgi:hypothetical protein
MSWVVGAGTASVFGFAGGMASFVGVSAIEMYISHA